MSCGLNAQNHPARTRMECKTVNACAASKMPPDFGNLLPIFRQISKAFLKSGCVIGINGADASGKTRFAALFSEYLALQGVGSAVVSIDDFHNPAALRRQGENPQDAYYRNAFDLGRLVAEVLEPWKRTGSLHRTLSCLRLESDRYDLTLTINLNPGDVMLLEGSLLFRPPILSYLDTKIFLDVSFPEILRRAQRRDVPRFGPEILEAYREKYIPVQKRYFLEFSPKDSADLLIENEDYENPRILRITPPKSE